MLTKFNNRKQRGFSMIELMVGLVVLGILAAVAVPSFQVWLLNSQIRNAAESISNGLQRARSEAVARNANVEFVISADSSWTVRLAGGALIDNRAASDGSKNVTVTTDPAASDTVTFSSFGGILATNPVGGTAPFTRVNVDSAALSADESQDLSITLNLAGIKMCDPHAPAASSRAC